MKNKRALIALMMVFVGHNSFAMNEPEALEWCEPQTLVMGDLRLTLEQLHRQWHDSSSQPLPALFPVCFLYEEHEGKKVSAGDETLIDYPLQGTMKASSPYTQRDQFGKIVMNQDSHSFFMSVQEVRTIAQACRLKLEESGLSHRKIRSIAVSDKQGAGFHVYCYLNGREVKVSSNEGFLTIVPELQQ